MENLLKKLEKASESINSNISNVELIDDRIIVTAIDNYDIENFEEEIEKLIGYTLTPCDVNINDWFLFLDEIKKISTEQIK